MHRLLHGQNMGNKSEPSALNVLNLSYTPKAQGTFAEGRQKNKETNKQIEKQEQEDRKESGEMCVSAHYMTCTHELNTDTVVCARHV